ncbi:uncharacterized protein PG998_012747 [Apiospora kogelbergensis]|uniref:uncharacterized protein n=1 Tax=Apiospora kogelbergensis TaxID=1337665 RepID=UPI00313269AD
MLFKILDQERLAQTTQETETTQETAFFKIWMRYPLHQATQNNFLRVANYLLDQRGLADASKTEEYHGMTPMDLAVGARSYLVVDMLIKRGITLNVSHVRSLIESNTAEACRLIRLSLPTSQYLQGQLCKYKLPLAYAVEFGNTEAVRLFLDSGKANVNTRDLQGRTALLSAAIHSNIDIMRLLLESGGAEVDVRDSDGRTPLSHATGTIMKDGLTVKGFLEPIQALLATGQADVDSTDKWGKTPLIYAITTRFIEVKAAKLTNVTPVYPAAEIVRLLLEWGANPKITDKQGFTAYQWWKDYYDSDEILALDDLGRKTHEEVLSLLNCS